MDLPSPKLPRGAVEWYRYYAGYSSGFAEAALRLSGLPNNAVVLDPWSGSGTTAYAAQRLGYDAIGVDVNPVLTVIAKGRLLTSEIAGSLEPLGAEIIEVARRRRAPLQDDPLQQWFDRSTTARLRSVDRAVQRVLLDRDAYGPLKSDEGLARVNSLCAFFYVALFEVTRILVTPFRSTNPTWVRTGADHDPRLSVSATFIEQLLTRAIHRLQRRLTASREGQNRAWMFRGDSRHLPLADASVDAVLTSPPYCTRIDYVVSALPELAVLGLSRGEARAFRELSIGTPTIQTLLKTRPLPVSVDNVLDSIADHRSRSSGTYYRQYFLQYFSGMSRSLAEVARVAKTGAPLTLVAQDSYYKDIHIPLASLLRDIATGLGWSYEDERSFPLTSTRAALNPRVRAYRRSFSATESVLSFLRKAS